MRDRPWLVVLLLLAALLSLERLRAQGADAPAAAPTRVAVVDLYEVLRKGAPFVAADEALRRWIDETKAALQVEKDAIAAQEAELALFEPGSAKHAALREEVDVARVRFEHRFEALERERQARIRANEVAAFDAAQRAIAAVAERRGIDLVLQKRSGELVGKTQAELASEIFLRDVLHHDPALDITAAVLSDLSR